MTDNAEQWQWISADALVVEGAGWPQAAADLRRLPARAEKIVRPEVWQRACSPAGLSVGLRTSASRLAARWTLTAAAPEAPSLRTFGLDCYGRRDDGRWCWVGVGQPRPGQRQEAPLNSGDLDGRRRDYRVYLPLGCGVADLAIGIPDGTPWEPAPPDTRPPVVIYGTSIVQGAGVSRPGLCWPSILGRRLDWPVVNLGFSSHGTMDGELASLTGEIDAALVVVDCLPNLQPEQVSQRLPRWVEMFRAARPRTPILCVGDRLFGDGGLVPLRRVRQAAGSAAQREAVQRLQATTEGVHLLDERNFFGDDFDGSTDTVHPNDIGALRMAEAVGEAVRGLIPAMGRGGPS